MKKIYANSFLLDTHIWFWLIQGDKKLNKKVRKIIQNFIKENEKNRLYISAITTWEIALLYQKKQLECSIKNMNSEDWIKIALTHPDIKVLNLNSEILIRSINLPLGQGKKRVHKDPADRMIISTAIQHNLTLITSDKKIIEYGKRGLVKVLENKK